MRKRFLFSAWAIVFSFSSVRAGSGIELFVTDYNETQSAEQRPLVERAQRFLSPRRVVVTRSDGTRKTFEDPKRVVVEPGAVGDPRRAVLFAARGEYEPVSFLLRPKRSLEKVFISATSLKGPAGEIPSSNLTVASVESFHGGGRRILVPLGKPWNMGAWSTELFWLTVKVPREARPGLYEGKISVTAGGREVGAISVSLEVLPFDLEDPPYALGFNYSSPKDPLVLKRHLRDMREHGMTTVAPLYNFHLPVNDADTSEIGEFVEAYKRAGFPGTLYFASPMSLHVSELAGWGDVSSERWQQKYIEVMLRIHEELEKHNVPVIVSIADELTNKGIEGVRIAGRLARFVWEELPEIATTSDMNGYREVMAMAPYLNVATFNNGWDGIDHHNGGRHLLNREFILELQEKTGAIPWFVNAGSGRFPFGFFFWKMTKYGVRGKVEWYYNLRNERGSLVRTEGRDIYPTLDYERSREGVDDLKYLLKLEGLVERARRSGKAAAERRKAEELLKRIADAVADDWSAYRAGGKRFPGDGFAVMNREKTAQLGPLNAIRRALADRIVALMRALE